MHSGLPSATPSRQHLAFLSDPMSSLGHLSFIQGLDYCSLYPYIPSKHDSFRRNPGCSGLSSQAHACSEEAIPDQAYNHTQEGALEQVVEARVS